MSPYRLIFMVFSFCLITLTSQSALAFRCGSELVSKGDSKISVLNLCGKPSWVDRWSEEIIEHPDTDLEHRISRINERWVYNSGPNQFLRFITFKDGKVFAIETGSRGFSLTSGIQRCDFDSFSLGATMIEIAAQCGQPDLNEQRLETITQTISTGRRQITVSIDEWTFNLGPSRFIRILTFRNGKLGDISTGEKGFN